MYLHTLTIYVYIMILCSVISLLKYVLMRICNYENFFFFFFLPSQFAASKGHQREAGTTMEGADYRLLSSSKSLHNWIRGRLSSIQ